MLGELPRIPIPRTWVNRSKKRARASCSGPYGSNPTFLLAPLNGPAYGAASSCLRFSPLATLISFTLVKRRCMSAGSAVRCVLRSW